MGTIDASIRGHRDAASCLDPDRLLDFVEGRLEADALTTTDVHLASCSECREVVAVLARGSTARTPGDGPTVAERVGRYLLLDTLGRGGMGVVHAAWDPELDRRIAIKLLRGDLGDGEVETARRRLAREGRAIAMLAHPNVVTVYDVGELDGGMFVAMEYVAGGTLAAWRDAARPVDVVVAAFEQAALGIAAAHAAGIVHRDIKPSNILIGGDGRVRVGDFGLAGPTGAPDGAVVRSGDVALTITGVLVGTPLYMAPETLAGGATDARSDQYAFAASLYEILAGVAPFSGKSIDELVSHKRDVTLAPPRRRLPLPVMATILRALAPDPAARWSSMTEVRARLARYLHRRRRRLVIAGAVVGVGLVGLAVGMAIKPAQTEALCTSGADRVAATWTPVHAALVRASAGDRAVDRLDRYAHDWVAGYRRVCEATHVRGDQSEQLLDIRMRCLESHRTALGALVEVLAFHPDATTRANAVTASAALDPIAECDAIEALSAIPPPPATLAPHVAAGERILQRAEALERAGRFAEAKDRLATAPALAYAPLVARIALVRGKIDEELGDVAAAELALHAAVRASADAHDDATAAHAWTLLVGVVGFLGGRPAEGLALAQVAEAAVARAGLGDTDGAELASMRGLVFDAQGKFPEARAEHERALAIRERTLGPDSLEVAQVLDNLGAIPFQQRSFKDAAAIYERALAIRRRALGEDHPDVAATWNSLGATQVGLHDLEHARTSYERAIAIWRPALGDDHPNVAAALNNLGNLDRDLGRAADATRNFEAAIAIWRRLDPHLYAANIGSAIGSLGNLAYDRGDFAVAEARLEEAIVLFESALGKDHPRLATQLDNLAQVKLARGDKLAADRLTARARALRAKAM